MDSLLLAKTDLPDGWIDASVGEPYLVRDNLFSLFDFDEVNINSNSIFEYSKPQGYAPLVQFLEEKHNAPVIISNGAKQAIGALLFGLKKEKIKGIYLRKPWWSLFPPLIAMHGLKESFHPYSKKFAELLVAPNNPDGNLDFTQKDFEVKYTIHDAAYYNNVYLPRTVPLVNHGDVQVFTCSKLFGLSQLRIGYSVFHNQDLYKHVLNYMEHSTVGVSVLSQIYALNVFKTIKKELNKTLQFEDECFNDLLYNRSLLNTINKSILKTDPSQMGMFLWAKCYDLTAFERAKVSVIEGTPFGMPGYIRMNLALPFAQINEIVDRLNNL